MYKTFIRHLLFLFPPEVAHTLVMGVLKLLFSIPFTPFLFKKIFRTNKNDFPRKISNLTFNSIVGLAAGFDKNAVHLKELSILGFGFIEIGTVTPLPQLGNPKPRLFRLKKNKALLNRMGFNNDGMKVIAERLKKFGLFYPELRKKVIIGGNISKNKNTPNDKSYEDYEKCFNELFDYVDYFVLNVSSPNTPDLRQLQDKENLSKLLTHVQKINFSQKTGKPTFLKIAPDLTFEQIDEIIEIVKEFKINGIICCNTTISRENLNYSPIQLQKYGGGGISGKPLTNKSNEIIKHIRNKTDSDFCIIGSGGIFSGEDALEKINSGADLVQVYTGFIYEGMILISDIKKIFSN